jgi:shikimate 5-dehydrogenase
LKENVLQDKLVVVLGSGGAGKAIAFGAKQRGARVVVTDYAFGNVADFFYIFFFSVRWWKSVTAS